MYTKQVRDKIVGLLYNVCVLNTKPIFDFIAVLTSLTQSCGVVDDIYEQTKQHSPNYLMRSMAIATHPNTKTLLAKMVPAEELQLCSFLNHICHSIIYNKSSWPDIALKDFIISLTFSNEEDLGIRSALKSLLDGSEYEINNIDVLNVVGGLYCLMKFITNQKDADITILLDESINSLPEKFIQKINNLYTARNQPPTIMYKYIATGLIGATVGYSNIYKHPPYFLSREQIDISLKFYFLYLAGESKKIKIGYIKYNGEIAIRWLHPKKEPAPYGIWADSSNPFAEFGYVSYIEHAGERYQKVSQLGWDCDITTLEKQDTSICSTFLKKITI